MRKGFSLIELMVIIAVLPFVLIVIDGFFATMFTDIPKSVKSIQNNSIMLDLARQIQNDIDTAKDLPQSIDGHTAGDNLLLIKLTDGSIHYQLKDNTIHRNVFTENQKQIPEKARQWLMPEAKIKWRVHRKNGKGYAVEIEHHIEYTLKGHLIKKMANSNMYFVGAFK